MQAKTQNDEKRILTLWMMKKKHIIISIFILINTALALLLFKREPSHTDEYEKWSHVFTQGIWLEAYYEPEHIELCTESLKEAISNAVPYRLAHDKRISEHVIVIQGKAKKYRIECIKFMNNPQSVVMKDDLLGYYTLTDNISKIRH